MKSKMSKACDISPKVKAIVFERDKGLCIVCGKWGGIPNAHYIRRSQGGLGIEENVGCLCPQCHHEYDNTGKESYERIKAIFKAHLMAHYPQWREEKLMYRKYDYEL